MVISDVNSNAKANADLAKRNPELTNAILDKKYNSIRNESELIPLKNQIKPDDCDVYPSGEYNGLATKSNTSRNEVNIEMREDVEDERRDRCETLRRDGVPVKETEEVFEVDERRDEYDMELRTDPSEGCNDEGCCQETANPYDEEQCDEPTSPVDIELKINTPAMLKKMNLHKEDLTESTREAIEMIQGLGEHSFGRSNEDLVKNLLLFESVYKSIHDAELVLSSKPDDCSPDNEEHTS